MHFCSVAFASSSCASRWINKKNHFFPPTSRSFFLLCKRGNCLIETHKFLYAYQFLLLWCVFCALRWAGLDSTVRHRAQRGLIFFDMICISAAWRCRDVDKAPRRKGRDDEKIRFACINRIITRTSHNIAHKIFCILWFPLNDVCPAQRVVSSSLHSHFGGDVIRCDANWI